MLRVTAGHDIEYPLRSAGSAVAYYLQDGKEPPGVWAGTAAGALGLTGQVDPEVYRNLFGKLIAPTGERLYSGRPPRYACETGRRDKDEEAAAAVAALGEFATPAEARRTRAKVLGSTGAAVPFYDLTFSATKFRQPAASQLRRHRRQGTRARRHGDGGRLRGEGQGDRRRRDRDRPAGHRPGRAARAVRPHRPPQRAYRRVPRRRRRGRGAFPPARQPQRRAEPARAHGAAQPRGPR